MFKALRPYRKAIVAGVLAALGVLYAVIDDGVTGAEWVEIVMAGLAGSGVTWLVPNTPAPAARITPRTADRRHQL